MAKRIGIVSWFSSVAMLAGAAGAQQAASGPPPEHAEVKGLPPVHIRLAEGASEVNPASGERADLFDHFPDGSLAPDRFRVAKVLPAPVAEGAAEDESARGSDIFINDIGLWSRVPCVGIVRRVTAVETDITSLAWLPDSRGLLFCHEKSGTSQVYFEDTEWRAQEMNARAHNGVVEKMPEGQPAPVLVSDGARRSWSPRVSKEGRVAWLVETGRRGKDWYCDVVVTKEPLSAAAPPASPPETVVIASGMDISAIAWSPDGKFIAWSDVGTLRIAGLSGGDVREVRYADIHPSLRYDLAQHLAWSPEGAAPAAIAAKLSFAGGRMVGTALMSDVRLFFIPVDGEDPRRAPGGDRRAWWVDCPEDVEDLAWPKADDGPGVFWR